MRRGLLKGRGQPEKHRLGPRNAEKFESGRQVLPRISHRYTDRREPGRRCDASAIHSRRTILISNESGRIAPARIHDSIEFLIAKYSKNGGARHTSSFANRFAVGIVVR